MVIVYVFSSLWSPVVTYASTTDVTIASVEAGVDANMLVSIAGNISPITEQMVTVRVIDPFGNTDYVNSTFSDSKGEFKFSYTLKNKYIGKYNVTVSGAGVTNSLIKIA